MNMIKAGKAFAVAQSLKPGKDKEMSITSGVEVVQVETAEPFTTTGDAQGRCSEFREPLRIRQEP